MPPPDQQLAPGQDSALSTARKGIDYSVYRPDPAAIRNGGYSFVFRYVSRYPSKNLTLSEAQKLIAWGLDLACIWENDARDPLNGRVQGVSDAKEAQSQAIACGMPNDRPIYFAVDFDATPSDQDAIDAYFDGVVSVIGLDRCGAYADYYVLKRLFDARKVRWGWQTLAWSGGNWEPRAQVRQIQNGDNIDLDNAVADDFGQWGTENNPALASFQGRLYLAWRDVRTNQLNLMYSADNGRTFGHRYTSNETSPEPPTLAAGSKALYIGWTGVGNDELNVAQVITRGDAISASPEKTTLRDNTSPRSPALASFQGRLFLAWKGNGNNYLNVMYSSDGGHRFDYKYTSKETSQDAPALCMHSNLFYIGWKGNGNNKLNVAQLELQGATISLHGKVTIPEDPNGASPSDEVIRGEMADGRTVNAATRLFTGLNWWWPGDRSTALDGWPELATSRMAPFPGGMRAQKNSILSRDASARD